MYLDKLGENGYNTDEKTQRRDSDAEQRGQNTEVLGGRKVSALDRGGDGTREQGEGADAIYEYLERREATLLSDKGKRIGSSGFLKKFNGSTTLHNSQSLFRGLRTVIESVRG